MITRFTMLILLLFSGIFVDRLWAQEISDIRSPRLRELAAQLDGGNVKALGQFWDEMATETTPLVEAIEGDPNHVLLTVLWRGDEKTENVLLVGGLVRGDPLDNTLEQLLETDLWCRTYWTRTDLRSTYKFSPNDPLILVPMDDAKAVAADTKPIRFFIECGLNEGGRPSMVITNRHFRDVLIAKDYEIVKYDEFNGGHEILNWRGSLADGLIALIGK